jgi:hypothetical protein
MTRTLLRWLCPLLLLAAAALPARADGDGESAKPPVVLPPLAALISTGLVLLILCKPSRKG